MESGEMDPRIFSMQLACRRRCPRLRGISRRRTRRRNLMKTQTNPKNVKNITKKQLKNVEKSIIILGKALFRPPEGIFLERSR